jgi:steroid 5-alpha reductase family enzyme
MVLISTVFVSLIAALVVVTVAFCIALFRGRRYDIIDVAWGVLFAVIAWTKVVINHANSVGVMVAIMVTIWAGRLSFHIFRRWLRSDREDRRYVELRQKWPSKFVTLQMFVRIYLGQAILACIVALPVMALIYSHQEFGSFVVLGSLIWLTGLSIETIADRQLRRYIATAKPGGLMTEGLWSYSRHPNYFGEILVWWGIAVMGIGTQFALLGFVGALVISGLIIFVSGIPPSERGMKTRSGWDAYKKRTSVLVPLPKR